jgi:hypothetical protein
MRCFEINDNRLCQIWGFFLFTAILLLILSIIFGNSTSKNFRELDLYFVIIGSLLFVVCMVMTLSNPIKRICCLLDNLEIMNPRRSQLLHPVLYHEPSAILHIVNGNTSIQTVLPIVNATYIQESDSSEGSNSNSTETSIVAVQIEDYDLPYQLNQV